MHRSSILIIENEPIISYDMQLEFMAIGYRVFQANDVLEAEEICRLHSPKKILINFHRKTSQSGWSLGRRLQRDFGAEILIVTGSRSIDVIRSPDFIGGIQILYKPFTRKQLREMIR